MNKPFYRSTGVMGAGASIVGCLVALVASLASLKGLEITPENQALIVSLVMTLAGGVAALIGRLKASDVAGAGYVLGEMASAVSLPAPEKLLPPRSWPAPPEDDACPKFGAHVLGCPEASAAPQESQGEVLGRLLRQAQEKHLSPADKELRECVEPVDIYFPGLHAVLTRLTDAVETLNAQSSSFVKDQAGCPSKDPAEPMAEGQLVGGNS